MILEDFKNRFEQAITVTDIIKESPETYWEIFQKSLNPIWLDLLLPNRLVRA